MAFKRRKRNRKQLGVVARVTRYGSLLMTMAGTILVIALVITTARWLADSDNFPITKVNVEGGFQYVSPEAVRAVVLPFVGSGFFQLDVGLIKQTLGEMPWVDAVVVRKVWPDTVFVHVKEQVAVARWRDNGLINRAGESFYPDLDTIDQSLPLLVGPDGSEKLVADQYKTIAALLANVDVRLVRLDYTARGSWQLEFSGGQVVMLGRENIDQRMHRLANLYRELEQSHPNASLATVDMRYDTGIAVQWRQQSDAECKKPDACRQASIANNQRELIF